MFDSEKEAAVHVKGFRPISLTTSIYKVIVKVLAERLEKIMSCIIALTQTAFIGGRQNLESVLIANEVVEEYRAKKKKGGFLNWNSKRPLIVLTGIFLKKSCVSKNFDDRWISWILGLH